MALWLKMQPQYPSQKLTSQTPSYYVKVIYVCQKGTFYYNEILLSQKCYSNGISHDVKTGRLQISIRSIWENMPQTLHQYRQSMQSEVTFLTKVRWHIVCILWKVWMTPYTKTMNQQRLTYLIYDFLMSTSHQNVHCNKYNSVVNAIIVNRQHNSSVTTLSGKQPAKSP